MDGQSHFSDMITDPEYDVGFESIQSNVVFHPLTSSVGSSQTASALPSSLSHRSCPSSYRLSLAHHSERSQGKEENFCVGVTLLLCAGLVSDRAAC